MPVKRYGIYLSYGPTIDLHKEGLGRLLAGFLKGIAGKRDTQWVIACPEWSREGFYRYCKAERIPMDNIEVVSTGSVPFLLRLYLGQRTSEATPPGPAAPQGPFARMAFRMRDAVEWQLASARSPLKVALVLMAAAVGGGLGVAAVALRSPGAFVGWLMRGAIYAVNSLFSRPGDEPLDLRLYRMMESAEADRLVGMINAMSGVRAWYCPTAFWPDFHRIRAPRLMCVPDVFHRDFPVGFARLEPELVKGFQTVERAIRGGSHFVTYSEHTRTRTVVGQYGRAPESVTAVHHAAWDLSGWLDPDVRARRQLLAAALRRRGAEAHAEGFASGAQRYLFYASQFRPNKNLLTLLQAYERLARGRGVTHKLILTGDPARFAPLANFIRDRRLENDVLCLHGLSMQELASFYSLADLALNPSLSEGGCPFTLTEALSVDTPVVMARIPVTEEVVVDPALREAMLFNPYDWRDAAARIEWALTHRDDLLARQREFFARLRQRRWEHVVDDYVGILERIAEGK